MLRRAVKRRRTDGAASNPVQGESTGNLQSVKPARELAKPYRVCAAKFPIDALTPSWSVGSNRPVNDKHVLSLCKTLEGDGLQRETPNNYLMIGCTGEQIGKLKFHHNSLNDTSNWSDEIVLGLRDPFHEWMSSSGQKAEIISGQHRVEALKMFLERNSTRLHLSEHDERWWVCEIYNLDKLPQQLKIKLGANRHDHTLLDSYAQVWMELTTLAESDPTLFQGTAAQVGDEMLDMLGLNEQFKFPIRRLVTLWKNSAWQPMTTEWCRTGIGHSTFNISLWAELVGHRIDDFWFDVIEEVREWILQVCNDDLQSIQLSDWNALVRLPSRSVPDVQKLFYPDARPDAAVEVGSYRRPNFLGALNDMAYYDAYQAVLVLPDRRFPDIQAMFRTGRRDGKTVSQLMCHVVQWVNPSITKVGDRENNKPPLWHNLMYPFKVGSSSQRAIEGQAQQIQRRILDVVKHRLDELSNLTKMPDTHKESYLERFESPLWKDILVVVHSLVGSSFQGVMARFNQQDPLTLALQGDSSLVSTISKAICKVPNIAQNPALRNKQALDILMGKLSPIIITWATEQCTAALQAQELGQAPPLPPSVLDTVSSELAKLNTLLPQFNSVQHKNSRSNTKATPRSSPPNLTLSPPRIEPPEGFQVQSPVASESGTILDDDDDLELPPLAKLTAKNLEIDEAELQRRRRQLRRSSSRISRAPNEKQASSQRSLLLPVPGATKGISTDEKMPWDHAGALLALITSRTSSKGRRPWEGRPAAQTKLGRPIPEPRRQKPAI